MLVIVVFPVTAASSTDKDVPALGPAVKKVEAKLEFGLPWIPFVGSIYPDRQGMLLAPPGPVQTFVLIAAPDIQVLIPSRGPLVANEPPGN